MATVMAYVSKLLVMLILYSVHAVVWAADEVPVTVKSFNDIAVYPEVSISASVLSINDSKISAEVAAVISKVPVQVGQTVKRGTILFELESDYFRMEYERANAILKSIDARLDLVRYQLQRAQSLSKQNAVSEELLKQRESELKALQAERIAQQATANIAKRDLEKCVVRSPFRSVIKARLASVGELAAVGTPVVQIIDSEHLEISAKVQASDLESLRLAEKIDFSSQGKTYSLAIKNVTPAYDEFERSQEVRFSFISRPGLPGAFGTLSWKKRNPHVPSDLMVRREGRLGVFVVGNNAEHNNKAEFISLQNAREGQPVEAAQLSGVVSIVVDGRFRLQHGDPVTLQ